MANMTGRRVFDIKDGLNPGDYYKIKNYTGYFRISKLPDANQNFPDEFLYPVSTSRILPSPHPVSLFKTVILSPPGSRTVANASSVDWYVFSN